MEERLKRLKELRDAATAAIDKLKDERKAITDKITAESRDFTDEEDTEFRAKTAEIRAKNDEVDGHQERITELEAEMLRAGRSDKDTKDVARATATVTSVNEPLTYQKGNGISYFRDLARASVGMANDDEKERLQRHAVDVSTNDEIRKAAKVGAEYRNLDRNDGTGGSFEMATVAA